jgi:hypothetical protein
LANATLRSSRTGWALSAVTILYCGIELPARPAAAAAGNRLPLTDLPPSVQAFLVPVSLAPAALRKQVQGDELLPRELRGWVHDRNVRADKNAVELAAASACAYCAGLARQQARSRAFTCAEQGIRRDAGGRHVGSPLPAVASAGYFAGDLAAVRDRQGVELPLMVTRA